MRGKARPARKELMQKALEVVLVRVIEQAATLEKPCRAEAGVPASLLEGARFGLVAVGRIQQFILQRGDLGRAFEARERLRPRFLPGEHALFLFQAGERELERRLGRRLEAALAAAREAHWRAVPVDTDAGRPRRARLRRHRLAGEVAEIQIRPAG